MLSPMTKSLQSQFDSIFAKEPIAQKEHDVRVKTSRTRNLVILKDGSGINSDVTLEGSRAKDFFESFDRLGRDHPTLTVPEALRMLASPYIADWS